MNEIIAECKEGEQSSLTQFIQHKKESNLISADFSRVVHHATFRCSEAEVIQNLVQIFTVHRRPLYMLEDESFKWFINPYLKACRIKMNRKKMMKIIISEASKKKLQLIQTLKNRLISLKFDGASRYDRKFLAIVAQLDIGGRIELFFVKIIESTVRSKAKILWRRS